VTVAAAVVVGVRDLTEIKIILVLRHKRMDTMEVILRHPSSARRLLHLSTSPMRNPRMLNLPSSNSINSLSMRNNSLPTTTKTVIGGRGLDLLLPTSLFCLWFCSLSSLNNNLNISNYDLRYTDFNNIVDQFIVRGVQNSAKVHTVEEQWNRVHSRS